MSLCEYSSECNSYNRNKEVLNKIENEYGKDNLIYKLISARLEEICNHKHLFCLERLKLKG